MGRKRHRGYPSKPLWASILYSITINPNIIFSAFTKLREMNRKPSEITRIAWNFMKSILHLSALGHFSLVKAAAQPAFYFRQNNQIFTATIFFCEEKLLHHLRKWWASLLMNAKCLFPSNSLWWWKVAMQMCPKDRSFSHTTLLLAPLLKFPLLCFFKWLCQDEFPLENLF